MRLRIPILVAIAAGLVPGTALGQNPPLVQLLPDILSKAVTMTSTAAVAGNPHHAHFIAALGRDKTPWEMNKLLVSQLNTFPIGTSSGGFVFTLDPETGLFAPASQSFGPGFAERALTNGAGRLGFGVNYQRLQLKSYENVDVDNGDLAYVLQHNDCCGVPAGNSTSEPFFEGDLVRLSLSLDMKTDIVAPFVSYGVTGRWDVGVVVPIVRVQLSPTITSTVDRIATCPNGVCTGLNQLIHSWDSQGQTTKTERQSGTAAGIGDVVFRTKYRFYREAHGGLVAGIDLRLPTGDKENLLGTGAVQTKLLLIASDEFRRVSPHVNFGYTISRGELSTTLTTLPGTSAPTNPATQSQIDAAAGRALVDLNLSDEVNYVAGFDLAAHPQLTLSFDLLGRTFLNTSRFALLTKSYSFRTADDPTVRQTTRSAFDTTGTGSLSNILGVIGGKFNIPGTPLLLTGNLIFPLNHAGLTPKPTPVFGLDYSFK
jgi:hypothetical protein